MDYPQMELQILQYLSSTDIINYYTAFDKSIPIEILSIFRQQVRKEERVPHGHPIWVCDCKNIIENNSFEMSRDFLNNTNGVAHCFGKRPNEHYGCEKCVSTCERCKYFYCQGCMHDQQYCKSCYLKKNKPFKYLKWN